METCISYAPEPHKPAPKENVVNTTVSYLRRTEQFIFRKYDYIQRHNNLLQFGIQATLDEHNPTSKKN
jgi:hypothetical protein